MSSKREPTREGSGRPLFYPEAGVKMRSHTVRTTEVQWSKLELLGGAKWLRDQIDAAKLK